MATSTDWLKAGELLFSKNGNKGLTITAVCKKLGVTKGSFYHHFSNLDEYLSSLELHMREQGKNVSTQKKINSVLVAKNAR